MRGVPRLTGVGGLHMMAAAASLCSVVMAPLTSHPAVAAPVMSAPAASFVHDINVSRVAAGLKPLKVATDLNTVANKWAAQLAKKGALSHNPALGTAIKNWTGLAENVGMGQTEPQLNAAFMHSAPHRANILAPIYSQIGVGVVIVNHEIYVVEDFRRPS